MKFKRAIFIPVLYIIFTLNITIVKGASNSVYENKVFYLNQGTTYHGTLKNISEATSLQECSSICSKEETCEAVLFSETRGSKCYTITYGLNAINISNMEGYSYFTKGKCMGIPIPDAWHQGCPQLYLNMGNIHGGVILGQSNPQFLSAGKIGSMYHHPSNGTGSSDEGFGFAWYTGTEHCFSQPKYCDNGVSYAMWINLLGDNGNNLQYFITTRETGGRSGITVGWSSNSLWFLASNTDTTEGVSLPASNFISGYGYNNWVHCVFVYKYGGSTPGSSDMKMYLNGVQLNATRYYEPPSASVSTIKFLALGNSYIRMNMDEFLIWQKMLSLEDIKKLYDAYQ